MGEMPAGHIQSRPAPYLSARATNLVDWLWPVVYGSTCAHTDVEAHVPTQMLLKQNYREFPNLVKLLCFENVRFSEAFFSISWF